MTTITKSQPGSKIAIEERSDAEKPLSELFSSLKTSSLGLSGKEAIDRLAKFGPNQIASVDEKGLILKFISKLTSPLTLTLIFVAVVSFVLGQRVDSLIVILMAVLSVVLSFLQEYSASKTAKKLQEMVKITVFVKRDGKKLELPLRDVVPGDIIELSAGKMVPADARIISSNNLHINQSALNGESFPVKKSEAWNGKKTSLVFDINSLIFMGSNVVGGSAEAVVLKTGKETEFGKLSHEVAKTKITTSFDKGITRFVMLMIRLIVILVLVVFAANFFLKGNFTESLLFALAVAIGLTPEMLPMIVTINLSKGARDMAKKKVIIKELSSIQNFGAMDVLCTDKTGTLTFDEVSLIGADDLNRKRNEKVFEYTYLNSTMQSSMENVLDSAIVKHQKIDISKYAKVDEIPFDFERRMMSVVAKSAGLLLITKGAPESILGKSVSYETDGNVHKLDAKTKAKIKQVYESLSHDGFRVLAVAYKQIEKKDSYSIRDEENLIFLGFVYFMDPPKPTASHAVSKLEKQGIQFKVLSGDNALVTQKICQELKIDTGEIVTGEEIDKLDDAELRIAVEKSHAFVRLTPLQKERIITALQDNKHVVGFIGDGINDAPSLKIADVGISVNNATDIARDAAQIILLEKNLTILADCIKEGRQTFANTVKYIKMGASSNFGNMISMTGASFLLPFLPMMPTQILLNNFLYDLSQVALPTDKVDSEYLVTPRPWNIKFLKYFIIFIGPVSSIFDFATFGVMLWIFKAPPELFHTGWFVESLTTQVFVVYIIRTNRIPFLESRPSKTLLFATLAIVAFGALLPYTALGHYFGFVPLPFLFFGILALISLTYLILTQFIKNWFTGKYGYE